MKLSTKCAIAAVALVGLNSQTSAFTSPQSFSARVATKLDATTLDEWQLLDNGSVVGSVRGHPTLSDGDIITTSPLSNTGNVRTQAEVTTLTGSRYTLGSPIQLKRPSTPLDDGGPGMKRATLLKGTGLAAFVFAGFAAGVAVGGEFGEKPMTIPEVRGMIQSTKVQTENK
jgi:hypothetical protein